MAAKAAGRGRLTSGVPAPRASLIFSGGLCAGRTGHVLSGETTLIGRGEDCQVVLDGDTVSRVHCEITRSGHVYLVRDRSRNGTYVNGERVAGERRIADGDELRVGQNLIMVRINTGINTSTLTSKGTLPQKSPLFVEMKPQIVVKGIEEGVTQPMGSERVIIGRRMDNQLILDDENISRQHALIERRQGGYLVSDLGSANGTFLNDRRLDPGEEPSELRDGDKLRIGRYQVSVSLPGEDCVLNFRKMSRW